MAEITAAMVQALREETNVSMMECKRALMEAAGDKAKAVRILRERGVAIAAKKASRAANQGVIGAVVVDAGRSGALLEVNCETDFVAKNANFQAFVRALAEKAAGFEGNLAEAVQPQVAAKIAEIGENIVVRRHLRLVRQGNGLIVAYVHLQGKVGVLVELGCEQEATAANPVFVELAKDLTLHVTASQPKYLTRADVSADVVKAEREIYAKQVTNKPPQIVDKIVDGKMGKFYSQICLLEQGFVKDPDISVTKLLEQTGKTLNDTLTLRRFVRYQVGE
jgi:elongation factor Ts